MFLLSDKNSKDGYCQYSNPQSRSSLNLNQVRKPFVPFPGDGMYSNETNVLSDNCYLEPMSALYSGMQKDCLKFGKNKVSAAAEKVMRQNGTNNLPDHFSRYGYNATTGTCGNGYCLNNHNGRYIVGENQLGKGIYGDPQDMAPQSWYDRKALKESEEGWFPHSPPIDY